MVELDPHLSESLLAPAKDFPTTLGAQARRHAPAYVVGTLMLAAFQLAMNRIDWSAKAAIDAIFPKAGVAAGDAMTPTLTMLGLAIFSFFARVSSRWFLFNAGRDVEYEVRSALLVKLHGLGTAFYRKMSAGEIMSRSTNDLQQVRLFFGFGVLNMANVAFAFASALQVMLKISPKLSLACLSIFPLLILGGRTISKGLFTRMRQNQSTLGRMSEVLQANLAGIRVVRSFALEDHERERFEVSNRAYLEASLSLARLRGSMGPVIGSVGALGIVIFFWYGSGLLLRGGDDGGLTPGQFFAFWLAFGRMTWPMIALGFSLAIVQRGRASWVRIKEIFDAAPEVVDGTKRAPRHVNGSLSVSKLSFSHGTTKVLDDVSFELRAGESLAILGRTGSGKSTLAMLLARLLPTPTGAVRIDGNDVCDLPLSAVRGAIGYAQQDAFLFSTTVSRNIGFALDDPDSAACTQKIRDASAEAQVLEETLGLPEQFDTVVGERGVQLSGGQKQRIALARALVWEPKILVLDDPLSAVDAKTEAAILGAIERQAERRTVVLITHRVAAASRCDSILVLDRGKVIERGTHEELLRARGLYAAFAEEQQMASELEDLDRDELEGALGTPQPAGIA